MKIEYNREDNTISVGKAVYKEFVQFKNSQTFASRILSDNGIAIQVYNNKERNKEVAELLGCSRSVLFNHFDKLQKKAFIAPIYDVLKKVSKFQMGKKFDSELIWQINRHKGILQEVYNDGLYNILPIVVVTGLSPKELKKAYKGAWKVLSKNSLHKNKLLMRYHYRIPEGIHELPTSLLKYHYNVDTLKYLANNFKGKWNRRDEMDKESHYYRDAERLAEQLGESIDCKWTPRRLKEEHDRMSKEITARKYSKDLFDSVKNISVKSASVGNYTATLLDNAFAIADEGNAMGHCVAGYADSVRQGSYLVYSVTKGGERSSTIGLNVIPEGHYGSPENSDKVIVNTTKYRLQQQYGRYNAAVVDEDEKNLAHNIVNLLNEIA